MKQSLQLKLGQQLTMTPQLQQAIRLLQLSTLDLQQEIQEALENNPMLEVSEDENSPTDEASDSNRENTSNGETASEEQTADHLSDNSESTSVDTDASSDDEWRNDDIPSELPVDTTWEDAYPSAAGPSPSSADNEDGDYYEHQKGNTESLQDHLLWQLNLTPMSDEDRVIALTIIDAVRPSGLLSQSPEEIHASLSKTMEELELEEIFAVLHRIQQFDPPGVAAQDLKDCLLIQLNQIQPPTPSLEAARLIVKEYLPLLANRDYKQLMRRSKLKEPELRDVIKLIQSLNPNPGDQLNSSSTEYVVPDVFVTKKLNRWNVQLNPDIAPRLRIHSGYASLVKRADTSSDNTFLKDNLQEARWFLKSLQSRNETLLKVATCIVERQQAFLDHGAESMKPLVLHDVADDVGMHESTVSRVTTQKYMHTPQGIFELKYFFSSHVSTDSGGECSSTAIRAIIKKLVAAESPKKPLSDSKIASLLAEKGIKVARRTIAKYRESLNIPASNERKRLV